MLKSHSKAQKSAHGGATKRTAKFVLTPRFDPVPLSHKDLDSVTGIIREVRSKLALSEEDKARLWGALLASKKSLLTFSAIKKHRGSSADLKLLQTIKSRCGEVGRLLQDYTNKKSLAVPESRKDGAKFYLTVLGEIQNVAERTAAREKTYAGYQPPETLQELYVGGLLATIFETIFKQAATATIIPSTGKPGPFIKFVLIAHKELGLPAPSPASVRTWRRRFQEKQKTRDVRATGDDGLSGS